MLPGEYVQVSLDLLLELQGELAEERAKRIAADAARDLAQRNFEWMRVMFNQSMLDREALGRAKLGVSLPATQIDREEQAQPRDSGATLPEDQVPRNVPASEAQYRGMVNNFEDIGDTEASRLGLEHDEAGMLK